MFNTGVISNIEGDGLGLIRVFKDVPEFSSGGWVPASRKDPEFLLTEDFDKT